MTRRIQTSHFVAVFLLLLLLLLLLSGGGGGGGASASGGRACRVVPRRGLAVKEETRTEGGREDILSAARSSLGVIIELRQMEPHLSCGGAARLAGRAANEREPHTTLPPMAWRAHGPGGGAEAGRGRRGRGQRRGGGMDVF